jgi:hypothetical protein
MKELYDLCQAKTKIWKELPEGHHNDSVAEPHYFSYIEQFISEHVMKGK